MRPACRRDLLRAAEACGVEHPGLIGTDPVEVLTGWGGPSAADREDIVRLMAAEATQGGSARRHRMQSAELAADMLDHRPSYR